MTTRTLRAALAVSLVLPMTTTMLHAGQSAIPKARTMHLEQVLPQIKKATGSFAAINGVKRTFTVDLHTTWNGKTLTMVEDFEFNDGERDRKTWRFTKTSPNTYSGTREDVIGETKVTLNGAVARFNYLVYLSPETQGNKVRFWDKMVLREDGTVLNTALVTKFGIPVAKTTVEFRKPGASHKTASR